MLADLTKTIQIVLLLGVTACSAPVEPATPTIIPTGTAVLPSPTPATEFILPATQIARPEEMCVKISQDPLPAIPGQLVIETSPDDGGPLVLLNLETGERLSLGGGSFLNAISPDGRRLADFDLENVLDAYDGYIIIDERGDLIAQIPDPEHTYSGIVGWLDNRRLMLNIPRNEMDEPWIPAALIIMDIYSGEQQELLPDNLPNFNDFPLSVQWDTASRMLPNPDLKTLIYPASEIDKPTILWDLQNEVELARIHAGHPFYRPQWSPDGTRFVTSAPIGFIYEGVSYLNSSDGLPDYDGRDLFLVGETGDVQRLTFYGTFEIAYQEKYVWSPDSSQIAFLLETTEKHEQNFGELSIVDVDGGLITRYCIDVDSKPAWSPDGRFIAVSDSTADLVYVVDLQTGKTWIIKDANVFGWMVSP